MVLEWYHPLCYVSLCHGIKAWQEGNPNLSFHRCNFYSQNCVHFWFFFLHYSSFVLLFTIDVFLGSYFLWDLSGPRQPLLTFPSCAVTIFCFSTVSVLWPFFSSNFLVLCAIFLLSGNHCALWSFLLSSSHSSIEEAFFSTTTIDICSKLDSYTPTWRGMLNILFFINHFNMESEPNKKGTLIWVIPVDPLLLGVILLETVYIFGFCLLEIV